MKIILEGLYKNTLFKEFIDDYGVSIPLEYGLFLQKYVFNFGYFYRIPRMQDKICYKIFLNRI